GRAEARRPRDCRSGWRRGTDVRASASGSPRTETKVNLSPGAGRGWEAGSSSIHSDPGTVTTRRRSKRTAAITLPEASRATTTSGAWSQNPCTEVARTRRGRGSAPIRPRQRCRIPQASLTPSARNPWEPTTNTAPPYGRMAAPARGSALGRVDGGRVGGLVGLGCGEGVGDDGVEQRRVGYGDEQQVGSVDRDPGGVVAPEGGAALGLLRVADGHRRRDVLMEGLAELFGVGGGVAPVVQDEHHVLAVEMDLVGVASPAAGGDVGGVGVEDLVEHEGEAELAPSRLVLELVAVEGQGLQFDLDRSVGRVVLGVDDLLGGGGWGGVGVGDGGEAAGAIQPLDEEEPAVVGEHEGVADEPGRRLEDGLVDAEGLLEEGGLLLGREPLQVEQLCEGGVAFDQRLEGGRLVVAILVDQRRVAVVEPVVLVGQGVGELVDQG